MPSPMLQIKPEDIDAAEKRGKYTASIIGCNKSGVLHAYLFAEAKFKVKCADADQVIVNSILRGKTSFLKREIELTLKNYIKSGLLTATTDIKMAASEGHIIIIAIPAEIDQKKKVNYSNIESTCKLIGAGLRRGSIIIVVSTVGVGVIEGLIRETLENTSGFKAGTDFGLAYSPIKISDWHPSEILASQERIIAAVDRNSLNVTSAILESIAKGNVKKTIDVKTAEAVTLFKAVQQDVSVALANELALFCEKVGIDYHEAHRLTEKNEFSLLPLPTLENEGVGDEPYLLLEEAENLDLKLRIPAITREASEEMIKHAVNLTKEALRNCGKTLKRAKISLLGISQAPNMKSSPKESVKKLAKLLETRGARISLYDSYFSSDEVPELQKHLKKNLSEVLEGADCILILTSHDQFKRLNLKKLKVMMKMPAAIVDFEGIVKPDEIEKEGFVFRGLGRGVWTK